MNEQKTLKPGGRKEKSGATWRLVDVACICLQRSRDLWPKAISNLNPRRFANQSKRILKYPWRAGIRVCHKSGNCEVDMTVKNQIVMTVKRIVYGAVRCCYWKSFISLICAPALGHSTPMAQIFQRMYGHCKPLLLVTWWDSAEDSRHVDVANSSASTLVLPGLNYDIICNL